MSRASLRRWRAPALGVLLALGVVAAACSRALLTYFPHRQHLAELACGGKGQPQCLTCGSCHQGGRGGDAWVSPTAERCTGCHENALELFRGSVRPVLSKAPAGKAILFPHDLHLGQPKVKGQCVGCHAGAVGLSGGAPLFPPMAQCLECHEHQQQFDEGKCLGCHREKDLRTLKPVSFLSHEGAWHKRHGAEARSQSAQCEACHAQSSCDACHDATRPGTPAARNPEALEKELVHRFDFLSRHALEAQSQPGTCVTCHAKQDCDACHVTRGVSAAVLGGQSPHPLGWGSGLGAATNAHGPAARRDIGNCAACHDQGPTSICVRCHRVGALGGSPHPTGWRSSSQPDSPECSVCHGGTP